MRIGFDVSQTGKGRTGCGYLAAGLVTALHDIDTENEYLLYGTFGAHFWDPNAARDTIAPKSPRWRHVMPHTVHAEAVRFWRDERAPAAEVLGHPQIVHSNNFFCPPTVQGAKLVYTLYDLSFLEYPEHSTEANRIGCFHGVFDAVQRADAIMAISDFSRRHLLEIFPHVPPSRVRVVYPGSRYADDQPASRPKALADRVSSGEFWLTVGTLEPRKNHLRLIEAYAELKKSRPMLPLVHAGKVGWLMHDFADKLKSLGLQDDVLLLGYVSDSDLRWLYQNCLALVYPSVFEGFGLPVLEAMSQRCCVIASNATSLPEVVGDAGLQIDPKSSVDIARAMARVLDEPGLREGLASRSQAQARKFSWTESARKTLDIYRELVQ